MTASYTKPGRARRTLQRLKENGHITDWHERSDGRFHYDVTLLNGDKRSFTAYQVHVLSMGVTIGLGTSQRQRPVSPLPSNAVEEVKALLLQEIETPDETDDSQDKWALEFAHRIINKLQELKRDERLNF